jgi:hypothetical protein
MYDCGFKCKVSVIACKHIEWVNERVVTGLSLLTIFPLLMHFPLKFAVIFW